MTRFTLGKNAKLHLKKEFSHILNSGKKVNNNSFSLWFCVFPNSGGPKLGIIISRKYGGAVQRNRIKRYIREIFRHNRHCLKLGTHIIIYPRFNANIQTFEEISASLNHLFKKAGILE